MSLPNTHYGAERLAELINGKKKLFFAGIGGVSMSSLAHISHLRGHTVTGYDRTPSALTAQLEEMGITVWYENDPSHVSDADALIYTVAIPDTLPEYREALRRGIPVISRADYLGYIMCGYRTRIGVCGMHGKSTTTSMLECIFRVAGTDPTVSCGAPMKDAGGHCDRIGSEDYFIFEACEYMDSFLDFYPTEAIVLNIEPDHLDYFRDLDHICSSFARFMDRTGEDGRLYLNLRDDNVMRTAQNYRGSTVTFGVECPEADYSAEDVAFDHGYPSFTLCRKGHALCRIQLHVPGAHNVCDALAAASAALENGIASETVRNALAEFGGAARRMDYKGKTPSGALVYDDYAHHPTEIASSLRAAAALDHDRLFCVFQPHTYSRTKELFSEFAEALAYPSVSHMLIAEIYSARETDTLGMSSARLAEAVCANGGSCFAASNAEIVRFLQKECRTDDLILIMGAGDIGQLCRMLLDTAN